MSSYGSSQLIGLHFQLVFTTVPIVQLILPSYGRVGYQAVIIIKWANVKDGAIYVDEFVLLDNKCD